MKSYVVVVQPRLENSQKVGAKVLAIECESWGEAVSISERYSDEINRCSILPLVRLVAEMSEIEEMDKDLIVDRDDFTEMCLAGHVMNFDGTGYFASSTQISKIQVYPDDVRNGYWDERFTHVVWYNQ